MNLIKIILIISLLALLENIAIAQKCEKIIAYDTTINKLTGTNKTWFQGTMIDTIIHYKEVTIDSIICNSETDLCDTLFFIQYFEKGWRYINDSLRETDSQPRQNGQFYKNKKVGFWDFTHNNSSLFSEGTYGVERYQYYNGERIYGIIKDKYYFLKDTIYNYINTKDYGLETITDTLYYSCYKNPGGNYYCQTSLADGQKVSEVPLKYLFDEVKLILSGYYNMDIEMKKTHAR